jgi:hypothetical protein
VIVSIIDLHNCCRPAYARSTSPSTPGVLAVRLPEGSLPEPSLVFSSVQEGGGGERSDRTQAELGRLLAVAGGYRVLASDGTHLGWLDHVRYERHADHPDEIIVRSRRLLARRRRVFLFSAVAEVRQRDSTVVVRGTRTE